MSTYTATTPTGPSPVRNPGIRATLTARAEANANAEQWAEQWAAQWQADRNRLIAEAIAAVATDLLVKRSA